MRIRLPLLAYGLCALFLLPAGLTQADDKETAKDSAKESAAASAEKSDKQDKKEDKEKKEEKKEIKTAKLASIVLTGNLAETSGQAGLFAEIEQDLRKTINRLDKAAKDDSLSGVVLRLKDVSLGRGRIAELRAAIARVRAADKKVYCRMDSADTAQYLVASACDEIVIPDSGVVILPGVRLEITFYKQLFDKFDVQADFLHMGAYKGAAEPYTRDKLSDEVRKNLTAIVDDFYEQMVETIAQDRKLDEKKVRGLIDRGLLTAKVAKEEGLIDTIAYGDQYEAELEKKLEVDEIELVAGYGKKKVDTDFSGPTGFFKLLQVMMGGDPNAKITKSKKVAVIYALGAISTGESSSGMFGGSSLGSDTIVKAIQEAEQDDEVVAIVLRIDSPGGSALASDLMWNEVVRCKKPVIASMGDVAASGGYYLAMGADKIYAEEGTLTGSIGVVGGKIAINGLMKKYGITSEVIARGKNAGLLQSNGPFTESQREAFKTLLEDTYEQFTTKAAQGRKMDVEKLEKLAGGQVWTGRMAKQNGLVDEVGTLRDAIEEAKRQAGLKDDEKVEELVLPEAKSVFDELFGDAEEEEPALRLRSLPVGQLLPEEAQQLGQQAETLIRVFREPAAAMMPFSLKIE